MASQIGGDDHQDDEHMSDAGGDAQLTAEQLAAQLAASEQARKAAEDEAATLRQAATVPAPKGVVNSPKPYTGKKGQAWVEWYAKWILWAAAVGLLATQMGPVLLTYIEGPAMQHLSLSLGSSLATASVQQIDQVLSAATLGSNPTDFSVRKRLFNLHLKRAANGRYDFEAFFALVKQLMLQAPNAIDVMTIIFVITQALPDAIAQHVSTDPTTGKPWVCCDMFMRHILTCADTLYRLMPAVSPSADAPRDKKRPRAQLSSTLAAEHSAGGPGDKHDRHKGKPSFVPGRTPSELNELRKAGACFKCGKPGHRAAACKSAK